MIARLKEILSIPLVQNVSKLASSNIIMYLLPLIVTPILTRIYAPEFFGEWGIFSSIVTITSVVLVGCYESAIVKSSKDEVSSICALCLLFGCVVVGLFCIVILVGKVAGLRFLLGIPCAPLLIVYLLVHVGILVAQNLANRDEKYYTMSVSNLLMGSMQALLRIIFGLTMFFSNGLIAGTVFAHIITLIVTLILIRDSFNYFNSTGWYKLRSITAVAKKYKKFPLFEAPGTLLAFAAFNLPIIILSMYYSKAEIGYYSVVIQLLLMPMSFVGAAIGKVYYADISKLDLDIKNETRKVLKITLLIAILPTTFLVFGGDHVMTWFLGEKWETAGKIAICLSIWSVPTILTQPIIPLYRKLNKQGRLTMYNLAYFILGVGSIICFAKMGFPLYTVLIVYAINCSVCKFALWFDIMKHSGNTLKDFIGKFIGIAYLVVFVALIIRIVNI